MARRSRSSRGARSKRRMMACISSLLGASMKAKPLDSCVSGLRMTLIASETRPSAVNQDLMSSAVTHVGRFPRNTVKLILFDCYLLRGDCCFRDRVGRAAHESTSILSHCSEARKPYVPDFVQNTVFTSTPGQRVTAASRGAWVQGTPALLWKEHGGNETKP